MLETKFSNWKFIRRSSTLARPPVPLSPESNLYKDFYLRRCNAKLCKLQSFISTPDLTSESASSDGQRTEVPHYIFATDAQLERPDVIQMHKIPSKDASIKRNTLPMRPTNQCHHHHQHNQSNNKAIANAKIQQEVEVNQPSTSFFADNCCTGSCKKITILSNCGGGASNANGNGGVSGKTGDKSHLASTLGAGATKAQHITSPIISTRF